MRHDTRSAAERIGIPTKTLVNWRLRGYGPPFVKLGGRIFYEADDLDRWIDAQKQEPKRVKA